MKNNYTIKDSITETQNVKFIIDDSESFEKINEIDLSNFQKAIVYCDEKLALSWWPIIEKSIIKKINVSETFFLKASEESKSISKYVELVENLEKCKCTRDDIIIVIGGGTILDAISYLASTYMRGISLFMIPTTLIGQSDASTAGKTCINTQYAKNILGTLFLPKFVYNNVQILKTNSNYDKRQGFSEIFKYGLLGSSDLIDLIIKYYELGTDKLMKKILKETIRVRLDIRKKDPLASNLGHTFGHAIEKVTNFEVNHGDAISVGIVMALEFGVSVGLVDKHYKNSTVELMRKLELNTKVSKDLDLNLLNKTMLTDKKSSNTHIRLVLIKKTGEPYINKGNYFYSVKPDEMSKFLNIFMKNNNNYDLNHWENLKQ